MSIQLESLMVRGLLWGLLLCSALAGRLEAALVDLTWTGTTILGSDVLGLFGPPGVMAYGTPYTARFRFDTSVSFSENLVDGSQKVRGGTLFAQPIPLVSADLTINGVTVAAEGGYDSQYLRQTGQGVSDIFAGAAEGPDSRYDDTLTQGVRRSGDFFTLPLDQPGEFDIYLVDNAGGRFQQGAFDRFGDLQRTEIYFWPSHVSITMAVPEPGALGLSGMALFGCALVRWQGKS